MRIIVLILLLFAGFLQSCGQETAEEKKTISKKDSILNTEGTSVETRFLPPKGFVRMHAEENSFAEYLRKLPLKPHNSEVKYFDGSTKKNNDVYDAVVNLPIGNKDLHQCADAIMRLRAEYLWNTGQFEKIHFNFTNGFRVDYTEWMKGKRITVKGNKTNWTGGGSPSNTYTDFWSYMEIIFTYAGTLSLDKELKTVNTDELQIGDIFIKGGSPGHAVIVVDAAVNPVTKEKIFLLAQSYMPAQEIQILKNPMNTEYSPWYSVNFGKTLNTPEWKFGKDRLKRFEE